MNQSIRSSNGKVIGSQPLPCWSRSFSFFELSYCPGISRAFLVQCWRFQGSRWTSISGTNLLKCFKKIFFCTILITQWTTNSDLNVEGLCMCVTSVRNWDRWCNLNNLTRVIHYSLSVSFNYSLFVLVDSWLFIIHYLPNPNIQYSLFWLFSLFIISKYIYNMINKGAK